MLISYQGRKNSQKIQKGKTYRQIILNEKEERDKLKVSNLKRRAKFSEQY